MRAARGFDAPNDFIAIFIYATLYYHDFYDSELNMIYSWAFVVCISFGLILNLLFHYITIFIHECICKLQEKIW